MKVIIAGSTGMIGQLILSHCLAFDGITEVISVVRQPTGQVNGKLEEIVVNDFEDYSRLDHAFKNADIGFFCIGVYTGAVPDVVFKTITVGYAVAFAAALEKHSPGATLCLLSGAGADRTEKSNTSFARYKGMAENQISKMNLRLHSFRPGYIYPVQPRTEPNFMYRAMRVLYPLIKALGPKYSIRSTDLAKIMFGIAVQRPDPEVWENQDMLHWLTR